jgi:hypothetical protein
MKFDQKNDRRSFLKNRTTLIVLQYHATDFNPK